MDKNALKDELIALKSQVENLISMCDGEDYEEDSDDLEEEGTETGSTSPQSKKKGLDIIISAMKTGKR